MGIVGAISLFVAVATIDFFTGSIVVLVLDAFPGRFERTGFLFRMLHGVGGTEHPDSDGNNDEG